VRYLLDTHIVIWWYLDSDDLSSTQRQALDDAQNRSEMVGVSDMSLWEIAKLTEKGRLTLHQPLPQCLEDIENNPLIRVLPITGRIATESIQLGPSFPADPADQVIAASARCHGLILLTSDRRIRRSGVVTVC
jgi:PIN domain nuclease of toxin-antitoxin system